MAKEVNRKKADFQAFYHSSITERQPYPANVKASWTSSKTYVFDISSAPISLSDAIEQGILTRKTNAKFLLEHVGVWEINQRYSNQWQVAQILITSYPDDPSKFAFTDDDQD